MTYTPEWIPFEATHAFSSLSVQYLRQHPDFKPFYLHTPDADGIRQAIAARTQANTNRHTLVTTLEEQYDKVATSELVRSNIRKLADNHTFTVCTAHQPNIFTGYLYFIYKIVHVIKLAATLRETYPDKQFVPVFYMGSEDNDLDELNHIYLNGDELVWNTDQKGAVGRMQTNGLEKLIDQINGQLSIFEHGVNLVDLLRRCYRSGNTIQQATLEFTDALFSRYGLVVLIPDHPAFKKQMIPVFADDLFNHTAFRLVKQTADQLAVHYHAQVNPREINLFYMADQLRERIVEEQGVFKVNNTDITFSAAAIRAELQNHPERFSPNVVLRGLFQETILPNIAFVGGGAEVAYWLELKEMFLHYSVPYPVILLRNSFLLINDEAAQLAQKLSLSAAELFEDESSLLNKIVLNNSSRQLAVENEKRELAALYGQLETVAGNVDATLVRHVKALHAKALSGIEALEKKLMRAEKRTFDTQHRQLQKLKALLFPGRSLQERKENFLPWYACYGPAFIDMIYEVSPPLPEAFGVLTVKGS